MSTATVTALEAHLRKNPDDWSSWLVYGDHLTEQGDVRGELIRLEHQHATAGLGSSERSALARAIEALIAQHQATWKQGVPSDAAPDGETQGPLVRVDWRHGFVVGLEVGWVEDTGPALTQFLASPQSRLLSSLVVSRGASPTRRTLRTRRTLTKRRACRGAALTRRPSRARSRGCWLKT